MTSAASIADLFPDAWTHDVQGEPQVFVCTVQVSGAMHRALDAAALERYTEEERQGAVKELYRDVTRRTGLTRAELEARTTLRWQDYSSNFIDSRLEIAALVAREADKTPKAT